MNLAFQSLNLLHFSNPKHCSIQKKMEGVVEVMDPKTHPPDRHATGVQETITTMVEEQPLLNAENMELVNDEGLPC